MIFHARDFKWVLLIYRHSTIDFNQLVVGIQEPSIPMGYLQCHWLIIAKQNGNGTQTYDRVWLFSTPQRAYDQRTSENKRQTSCKPRLRSHLLTW